MKTGVELIAIERNEIYSVILEQIERAKEHVTSTDGKDITLNLY